MTNEYRAAIVAVLSIAFLTTGIGVAIVSGAITIPASIPAPTITSNRGLVFHVSLDSHAYVASWTNDTGEKVIVQGSADSTHDSSALFTSPPDNYYYVIKVNGHPVMGGETTVEGKSVDRYVSSCPNYVHQGQWGPTLSGTGMLQPCIFTLTGPETGVIEADLYVRYCLPWPVGCPDATIAATDYASLESGLTDLYVEGGKGNTLFQEGDAVTILARSGGCGSWALKPGFVGCYYVLVENPLGQTVDQNGVPCDDGHCGDSAATFAIPAHAGDSGPLYSYTDYYRSTFRVPHGAFHPRDVTWSNVWHIELVNTVTSLRNSTIFTVDSFAKAPPAPTFTVTPQPIISGTITQVHVTAKSNPQGALELGHAYISVWYGSSNQGPNNGGTQDWITHGTNVTYVLDQSSPPSPDGVRNYTANFAFTAPHDGDIQVQVVSFDTDNRPGESTQQSILTVNGKQAGPNNAGTGRGVLLAIAALIVAVLAIIVTWVAARDTRARWIFTSAFGIALVTFEAWVYVGSGGFAT